MENNHIKDLYKTKRSLELEWEQDHINNGIYTINMVRIDEKIKEVISHIKVAEAKEIFTSSKNRVRCS
jgi:hypothetical protein